MLKKLFLTVALVGIGAASYGVARAWFYSETPGTTTATLNAGKITLEVGKHDGYNDVPFTLSNWMPGQKQEVVFGVKNTSTVPVKLAGIVNGTWGGDLGDQFVEVSRAEYWDGTAWADLYADQHGTFTYQNRYSSVPIAVPAGESATLKMEAYFEPEADNRFQNKTYTATLKVWAAQPEGTFPVME